MSETYQLQPMLPRCWKIEKDGTEHWQCNHFILHHHSRDKARDICNAMLNSGQLRSWYYLEEKGVRFTFKIEFNEPLDWISKSVKIPD